MKLYKFKIENSNFDTKYVIASNVMWALKKYQDYLETHISQDYSAIAVFEKITNISLIGEYVEDEDIIR